METTENTQIEAVLEGLLDQDYQVKRHKVLIRDIQQESLKEGRIEEDGLLVEFPCTPTRARSVYSY
jgi:hypothetical protein